MDYRESSVPYGLHSTDGSISTSWLHAELARRRAQGDRPECGSGTNVHGYNTALHVAALFLILTLSTLACSFPIIVRRFPRLPIPNYALFVSRHFGTGVLIATAFVHLLPTAYMSLTDPCLPPFWNQTYPAMSGFIAMVSVLVVVGIEMFFAAKGAGHSHSLDLELLRGDGSGHGPNETLDSGAHGVHHSSATRTRGGGDYTNVPLGDHDAGYADERGPNVLNKPLPSTPPYEDESDLDLDELDPVEGDGAPLNGNIGQTARPGRHQRQRSRQIASQVGASEVNEQRAVLQCLLLEAGILFHSVFIGMALSVSTGPAFLVLLLAISFHQTFEGLALGSRIAAINSFSTSSVKPWLMSIMYGITTPIGQAIGLAAHRLYDPASEFGLLVVGSVNAISTGLLLYAGLVQLLAEDFLSDHSYDDLRGRRRLEACAAVVCGCMLMAFVGAFA